MGKQKDSSTVRPSLQQAQSFGSPRALLSRSILQKLCTLENLLKKKDDKPLTFKEACAYLGYAPSYLYKLTYRKVIPHYKPTGKMIFFSKNELDEWIYKNRSENSVGSKENDGSAALVNNDPNQVEMFDKKQNQNEILIEFPLKSRRKK